MATEALTYYPLALSILFISNRSTAHRLWECSHTHVSVWGGGVGCALVHVLRPLAAPMSHPWWTRSKWYSKLLIPSHQHEMLIVRESGSRRLPFVCSSQALISAGAAEFGFPNDSPVVPVLSDPWKHTLGIPSCSISVRPVSDAPLSLHGAGSGAQWEQL